MLRSVAEAVISKAVAGFENSAYLDPHPTFVTAVVAAMIPNALNCG